MGSIRVRYLSFLDGISSLGSLSWQKANFKTWNNDEDGESDGIEDVWFELCNAHAYNGAFICIEPICRDGVA